MAAFLSPIGNGYTFFTAQGVVLSGGQIATYLAGTTTPAATYTDSTSVTPNANPIILGSNGIAPQEIWLTAGMKYKFVILDANSNVLATYDNISGVNDSSASISQWIASGFTPTFISTTSFSVPGDGTAIFTPFRRIQVIENSGIVYGTVLTSTFATGVTTVTVAMDTLPLDSGMSVVNVSFLSSQNQAIPANISAWEKIKSITASVASNALTCTLNPANLDFRSTTLGSGAVSTISMSSAVSVVVPSTATLGTVSAVQSRLVLVAINNGGVVELAVINNIGGNNLDETTLINTIAISSSATAANVFYSTTARTGVPFRVVGYIQSTQATAGTWVTPPSTEQGAGGLAVQLGHIVYTPSVTPLPGGGVSISQAHGLGACPFFVQLEFVCLTADNNYVPGDVVQINGSWNGSVVVANGIYKNITTVGISVASTFAPYIQDKVTGVGISPTVANWAYRFLLVK